MHGYSRIVATTHPKLVVRAPPIPPHSQVIVAASVRTQCKAWAAGDESGGIGLPGGGASGIEGDVGVTDTTDISGAGSRKGATQATAAGTGAAVVAVDDGDDSDGDLGAGSRRGGRV